MKIPSNVITSWTNVLRSICLQVGYYREFTPNGCDEIEWGLVGGPVWKLMVDLEGFDLTIATIIFVQVGKCLLVGDGYDGGKLSGDMTYLYPGFTIGIVGQYQGGHLRAGREAVLVKHGISKNPFKKANNCLLTT